MMTPTTQALLQLSLVKGVGPARLRKSLQAARARGRALTTLVELGDLAEVLSSEQLRLVRDVAPQAEVLAEQLRAAEVTVVGLGDDEYPRALLSRLGDQAPPLLMVRGRRALLQEPSTGFCGSRAASPRGLEVADDCADQLARAGIVVTSGYAAGVDVAAHRAALRAGGTTTLVLAEGIMGFRIKPELADVWSWDRVCVVSELAATAPWSAGNAMQRNRTIVGLGQAMILIEAGATGGSIAAGRDALAAGVPLFAPEYDGMPESATGNRALLQDGARPLYRARSTGRANLEAVIALVRTPAVAVRASAQQMPLLG